jgi:translation initiation factor 2B subunit (eIF-2B alpha/beta/delta family)
MVGGGCQVRHRNPRSAMRYIRPVAEAVAEVTTDADHPAFHTFPTRASTPSETLCRYRRGQSSMP